MARAGNKCFTRFVLCYCWRARLLARSSKSAARCSKIMMQRIPTSTVEELWTDCFLCTRYQAECFRYTISVKPYKNLVKQTLRVSTDYATCPGVHAGLEAHVNNGHCNHAWKHRQTLTHICIDPHVLLTDTRRFTPATHFRSIYAFKTVLMPRV